MAFTYKLPKQNVDRGAFIDTPLAADTAISQGELTLKDEDGNDALTVKISDITGWKYDAYAAGTAHVVDVDLTAAVQVANGMYALTVRVPYLVNFFGGGAHANADARESRAEYITRTYTVSADATPTVAELQTAFIDRITADTFAAFSAASAAGDIVRITALSASAGQLEVSTTVSGATVADQTAWVSPVGSADEVADEIGVATTQLGGTTYNRYVIEANKQIRHNAVKGLEVIKPEKFAFYLDTADGGTAAAVTLLTSILDGSYATTADYLGAPNF